MKLTHVIFDRAVRDAKNSTQFTFPGPNNKHANYEIDLVNIDGAALIRLRAAGNQGVLFPNGFVRYSPLGNVVEMTPSGDQKK